MGINHLHDPQTGTTLAVLDKDLDNEAIKTRLDKKREEFRKPVEGEYATEPQSARPTSEDAEVLRSWRGDNESARIAKQIAEEIEYPDDIGEGDENGGDVIPLVDKDAEGRITSAASLRTNPVTDELYISYIATNPELLGEGHGTKMLHRIFKMAADRGSGLSLEDTPASEEFWKKMGAKVQPDGFLGWTPEQVERRASEGVKSSPAKAEANGTPIDELKYPEVSIKAKTGEPITIDAYRASTHPEFRTNEKRGTFFSPEATPEHGDHIYRAKLQFKNPLVADDGVAAAKALGDEKLAARFEQILSGVDKNDQPLSGTTLKDWEEMDSRLAKAAKAAGHDGVVFHGHDDLNPVQYMALDPKAITNAEKVGKFDWTDARVKPDAADEPSNEGEKQEEAPKPKRRSKVVSPAKEVPPVEETKSFGVHPDDLPRRAKYQDVDFDHPDLQDTEKRVTAESIKKDYVRAKDRKKVSVYQSYIPMEDLPTPKFVDEQEESFDREDYRPNVGSPIKVDIHKNGSVNILDGNHRVQVWGDNEMEYAPAWVIDHRGPNIEHLSEDERAERAEAVDERVAPMDLQKNTKVPSEKGYVYHATNADRMEEIAESGKLNIHKPDFGTDQDMWPDGSTEKRNYFTREADSAWHFAPEEGKSVILRMKEDAGIHKTESGTGDVYSKKAIKATDLEYRGEDGQWHPVKR